MHWSRFVLLVMTLLGVGALVGCAAPNRVVIDTQVALADGQSHAWKFEPGTYKVDMTASTDGATVTWVGCSCPGSGETKAYSTTCELKETGQLLVVNPSTFGTSAGTTVTIKVTRIGARG